MRIAIPIWFGRVSPLWDVARQLRLTEIEVETVVGHSLMLIAPMDRTAFLVQLNVTVLICGAISKLAERACTASGIRVHPQIRGDVDDVIAAYLANELSRPRFRLPGTNRSQRPRLGLSPDMRTSATLLHRG